MMSVQSKGVMRKKPLLSSFFPGGHSMSKYSKEDIIRMAREATWSSSATLR